MSTAAFPSTKCPAQNCWRRTFLSAWQKAHPADEIERLDLTARPLSPLMGEALVRHEDLLFRGQTDDAEFALAPPVRGG